MSGSSIGGVVGGAIGFMIGGPAGAQVGWMLGSAVGGYLDPDVITGPRLTDAQAQTSNEGVPRPIVYGTTAIAGNLIQSGPLIERKKRQRQGKGGGPVQETYHYYRTYAIRICEAAPLGGEMQLRRVWRDDKLVYSAVAGDAIDADSASFATKLRFYSGSETQLPDASLEAMPAAHGGGVGNVPAYRGTCYAVIVEDDVTERGGSIPQYRWEVTSSGAVTATSATLDALTFSKAVLPWKENAHESRDPRREGVVYEYGYLRRGQFFSQDSIWGFSSVQAAVDAAIAAGHTGGRSYAGNLTLRAWAQVNTASIEGGNTPAFPWAGTVFDANTQYVLALYVSRYPATIEHDGSTALMNAGIGVCSNFREAIWSYDRDGGGSQTNIGVMIDAAYDSLSIGTKEGNFACTPSGTVNSYYDFVVWCRPVAACSDSPQEGWIDIPDSPGFYLDRDGNTHEVGNCAPVSGSYKQLALSVVAGNAYGLDRMPQGPVLAVGDPDDTQAFWTAAYNAAVAAGTLPAGMIYQANGLGPQTTYPRVTSNACECTPSVPRVSAGSVLLGDIVEDVCERVGLAASQLDVAQLTDSVRGYALARQMPATEAIKPLQQAFFFDYPEWDRKLRGIKRGGASLWNITDDNLVYSDDDQDTRLQAIEFPRKFHLVAPDPDATYEPVKQTATRRTDNIKAQGEQTLELAVVFSRDEAAQVADKMLKIAWEEAAGKWERELPEEFSGICPSNPLAHDGKRWRVVRTELTDGTVKVEAVRDRTSAYTSTASGTGGVLPTTPISSLRGPTIFAAMNLPRLRTADSSTGMYIAVQGLLPGWIGCDVQMSLDNGASWQSVLVTDAQATIGTLENTVSPGEEPIQVHLYAGGELESVTDAQLAARMNGFAVNGEVGQFKTATSTGTLRYDLTTVARGQLGTTERQHDAGSTFVLLDGAVSFVPIDAAHIGKTLRFRPVSIGTVAENNPTYDVVFDPQFTAPAVVDTYTDAAGEPYTNAAGDQYYKVT